ncbi:MAG: CoA transferase [Oligoflexia bacterium]|nr:CoA transferase [Oligoflexia bacterium]
MSPMNNAELRDLVGISGLFDEISGRISVIGRDPIYDTPFRIGEAAATALAAQGAAVARIWELRSGRKQSLSVDVREAAISLQSVLHLRQNGYEVALPEPAYPTIDFYQARDGRWVFLHGGYPLLRDGVLSLLDCSHDRASIAKAVARWHGQALEDAIIEAGLTGGLVRSAAEWREHPQGRALGALPVVEVEKIGESAPEPFTRLPTRPLSGVRVLDFAHVLAGPTCARTLAEQGAEVLRITAPHRPNILPFSMDTGHGKFSAHLDLNRQQDTDTLRGLLQGTDVFSQSYRPGKTGKFGFSPEEAAGIRPGIIYVSTNCFGSRGPWASRPGWEQIAQVVTGMALEQGAGEAPKLSPVFPNDYITGYLAAYGALIALLRRATEGGSYHVQVSLCQTAMWLMRFDRVAAAELPPRPVTPEEVLAMTMESETPYGQVRHLGPVTDFSETRAHWELPTVPLGSHRPEWPEGSPRTSTQRP